MPAVKVVVNLPGDRSYDVRIGAGVLDGLPQRLRKVTGAKHIALVSDTNVAPLYAQGVRDALERDGFSVVDVTIPAGEASKSVKQADEVWQALAQAKLGRDGAIVALGGGVVGDLAGFAAATYMRGIDFIQAPTSLLAMVDSSVGGKTGIDLDAGKNLVGAFKQPVYVCADTNVLATLNEREWACGCGEIAKSALIDSDDFFFWLGEHAAALAAREADVVREAIVRCVVFKADVVARDETESSGARECLNYGHTLGHAVETLAGFGAYSHGQAVAEGMRFALRMAAALEGAPIELVQAQDELLDALGLPALDFSAPADEVLSAMHGDKKARGGKLRFVLPRDVGQWAVREVEDDVVRAHVDAWARSKR